ncbi:MAG TPA: serine/threonine-protein kinase [Ktedonobacteraceae bacterium]|nr:serine/threonine-protein kinase [Ktedonobacteraceae bacterium]
MAASGYHRDQGDYADLVGQQIGNYQLVQLLGLGNFASVYLGEHHSDGTQAAVKVLLTELADREVEKFLAQAEIIAGLDHPHIVGVHEFGLEDGKPFLVMDYAPNGTLRQRHPKGTQLPLTTIVSYVKQIADALQYVHDQNLIHRDVKPHNMLLGANHQVMLSDFGIAVIAESMGYRVQKVHEFEGTILYAAPEQVRGRPRIASDQYALGIVVYEWLTGSWPFHGTVEEIASQHTLVPPPPLKDKLPTISPAIEQVVFKALAKDPHERFESIQEFARALERASRLERPGPGTQQPTPHPLAPLSPLPLKTSSSEEISSPRQVALLTYRGHTDRIYTLAWSPDGERIASSSLDESVQVWDALTGENMLTYRDNSLHAPAIVWSPDGKYIASSSGLLSEKVQVWDASNGQVSAQHVAHEGHSERVQAIAWSPGGKLIASASEDGMVQVWDAASGRSSFIYRGHTMGVKSVAWSPDGKRITSASEDKTVQVWDATTGGNIYVYYAHLDKVNAATWSRGGSHIASASDDATVQVWDEATGRKVLSYTGHAGGVTAVAWSPDGIRIASSGLDETVQVWHAISGKMISTYSGHSDWVCALAWSADGKRIASGSWDKTVQVWEVR